MRQVTHALLTRPPLSHSSNRSNQSASFDLHVLSTPPAFILSQDQTLMFKCVIADVLDLYQIYCLKVPINDWTFVNSFELLEYSHLILSRFITVELSMFLSCSNCLFISGNFCIIPKVFDFVKNFFHFSVSRTLQINVFRASARL